MMEEEGRGDHEGKKGRGTTVSEGAVQRPIQSAGLPMMVLYRPAREWPPTWGHFFRFVLTAATYAFDDGFDRIAVS